MYTITDWIKYFLENRAAFPDFIQEVLLTASADLESRIESHIGNIANGILSVF